MEYLPTIVKNVVEVNKMSYGQYIRWDKEYKRDEAPWERWSNHGRRVVEESCEHYDQGDGCNNIQYQGYCDECGIGEDYCEPMYNYIYPLELDHYSDEKILEVVDRTACTVMENQDAGIWYLTLTGCGMDLTQDIALAYVILDGRIPEDLMLHICPQAGLSQPIESYIELSETVIEEAEALSKRFQQIVEDWQRRVKRVKEAEKDA